MKYSIKCTLFAVVATFFFSCENRKPLFEPDSDSWLQKGDAKWEFANGEIYGSLLKGTGFIMTKDTYKDFELELEFYPDETINSGVFVRCKNYELSYEDCYEINIWDYHPDQPNRTGAIVSRTTPLERVETIGKWNTYKIRAEGNHIQAWINGTLVADLENEDLNEGYIGLQAAEIGMVRFRNVNISIL